MAVSIKNKIRFGTLFLFVLLLLSGGISIYFIKKLQNDSKNILAANYESVQYSRQLQAQLDSFLYYGKVPRERFDQLLQLQEKNVTEKGEAAATTAIRSGFNRLNAGDTSRATIFSIQQNIQTVLTLNLQAIVRKNLQAGNTADDAFAFIIVLTALIFIAGFTFSVNFPAVVSTPIQKLTEAIREITKKNYSHRIHLETKDEFRQLADAFNQMSSRLEEFENSNLNKLIFEKSRAEAVINSLKDASIGIDRNEKILFANKQALQLLGLDAKEMVGRQAETVAKQNDLFDYLLNNESGAPFKIVLEGKENYYQKETIQAAPEDAYSRIIVLKNITSFKELDVAKTNFIATVSHELKTPLASSDFSLKLLEDERIGQLGKEQQELVQQLKQDNQRMLKILSELLNMTQVETGKVQLHIVPVQLQHIIEASLQNMQTALKEKNLQVIRNIDDPLPTVPADADKIGWVINNFLTNAIKFSPAGAAILVTAQVQEHQLTVSVKDQGSGIDPIYQQKIFDRYFQVPGRHDAKGSGIGLAICKDLIEAMGGRVWVKSEVGTGSVFGFELKAG